MSPSDSQTDSSNPSVTLSVVERAAGKGIGPLSKLGETVWHGQSKPCVSCGQLVRRESSTCDSCMQDLSPEMLEKMKMHAGPWYVQEHVRPFPGVSLERLIRQIRRGVLTKTTVIRGPATAHQWRFAAETPVLSKFLGCCWVCQSQVNETDTSCPACEVDLDNGAAPTTESASRHVAGTSGESAALSQLSAAIHASPSVSRRHEGTGPSKIAGLPLSWVLFILFALTFAGVFAAVNYRRGSIEATLTPTPAESADVETGPAAPLNRP